MIITMQCGVYNICISKVYKKVSTEVKMGELKAYYCTIVGFYTKTK